MKISSKNKILKYSYALFLVIGISFLLFNDFGYIKYSRLKNQVNQLKEEVRKSSDENKNLEAEIDSLRRKDPHKIEQIAREKYGMMKRGEKIIRVEIK